MKTQEQIQEAIDRADYNKNQGRFSGMTYEQGIADGLRWVIDKDGIEEDPTAEFAVVD